jgi:hypothetical protein
MLSMFPDIASFTKRLNVIYCVRAWVKRNNMIWLQLYLGFFSSAPQTGVIIKLFQHLPLFRRKLSASLLYAGTPIPSESTHFFWVRLTVLLTTFKHFVVVGLKPLAHVIAYLFNVSISPLSIGLVQLFMVLIVVSACAYSLTIPTPQTQTVPFCYVLCVLALILDFFALRALLHCISKTNCLPRCGASTTQKADNILTHGACLLQARLFYYTIPSSDTQLLGILGGSYGVK